MASEWPLIRLGDHCLKIGSGATPRGGSESYLDEGPFALIRSQNVYNDGFKLDGLAFISEEQAKKLDGVSVQANDVLLNITGDSVARVCLAPKEWLPARVSQHVSIIRPDPAKLDPRFLRYFLASPNKQARLLGLASSGATRNALTKGMIEDFYVPCPDIEEQREIADVLSSFDDKIELNRRMNATLEAMAQALFKSWFVDFDPVKAKAAGRAPEGMDADTAALFPSEFQNSELGLIPKGWRCSPLNEAFEINPTRKLSKGTEASYLDMANVPTQGHRPVSWINRTFSSGTKFINGDTLLARITPCLENGKTAFVDFLPSCEPGWGSTEFIVIRPKPPLPEYFAYLLCREPNFRAYAIQSMTGTSGRQRVQVDSLGKYLLTVSSDKVGKRFGEIIAPLVARSSRNSEESSSLAEIRDALLPKLISGQLRIPEAEALAEAAR